MSDDLVAPRITSAWLRRHEACAAQVAIFEQEWPDGAEITEAHLHSAVQLGLDLHWLAGKILSAPASKAYDEAVATASKAFAEAMATASKAFAEAMATASKAYDEAVATASKAFAEAMATALWDAGSKHGWREPK